jgi:hypothetical protein
MRLAQFTTIVDTLCSLRRHPEHRAELDRALLEQADVVFEAMTPVEQDAARDLCWRAWPNLVDERRLQA